MQVCYPACFYYHEMIMGHYRVRHSTLEGTIALPSSKSQTLRALLFGTLAKGKSIIYNPLNSPDTDAMVAACQKLGATINIFPEYMEVHGVNGVISAVNGEIDAGNSGIVLRFCAAAGALGMHPFTITGDHSIRHQRPVKPLLNGLAQLGATATSLQGNGFAPIRVQGPLTAGCATISGEDSQPISALLIASAMAKDPTTLHVRNPGEKPWVALTLDWFDRLGIPYENHNFERYHLVGNARYEGFNYSVPGDFSSAAFPLAAALVTGSSLSLTNVDMNDPQGDKELIEVFRKMGAQIEIDEVNKIIHVKKGPALSGITVDVNNFIDAVPILAVVACFAKGKTCIHNAAIAKQKECNRLHCITNELRKMGADIVETADGLIINHSMLSGTQVNSHNDHRMAMALAVAAMGASGETLIEPVECVSKTFPCFARNFCAVGAHIKECA